MGRKGESICSQCGCSLSCSDFVENKKLSEEGFCISILECDKFKK